MVTLYEFYMGNIASISELMVTPSANRNSYRVAKVVRDDTQGRGAAHLNPGLGNRNSYRVAFGRVLAHIISTHSKDGDSQWPKLWAAKTVGLGNATPLDFRYAQ